MFKRAINNGWSKKINSIVASILLVIAQVGPVVFLPTQASAVINDCVVDTAGANDEPNQKDLTKLCVDDTAGSSIDVEWNWDDIDWSGNNSGDACALFDTDNDGNVNYSVCVVIKGSPAAIDDLVIYSCGDDKIDRCTQPVGVIAGPYLTSCSVSQTAADPFVNGNESPNDTTADCTLVLSDVGGAGNTELVDVCSYPSNQPNSDPSDCIILRDKSIKVEVRKVTDPTDDPGLFDLKINGVTYADDVGNGGTTGEQVIVGSGNGVDITVLEAEGPSTDLATYTTSVVCKDLNGNGSTLGSASPTGGDTRQLSVNDIDFGSDVVCTFTNSRKNGSIKVVKDVINDNGGTKTFADFSFQNNLGTTQSFTETTSPDGEKVIELPAGASFSITEPEANTMGYSTSYSGDCSGTVTEAQQSCTITNNDIAPSLTLIKNPINNNGGNALPEHFVITVDGNSVDSGVKNTYQAGVPLALNETQLSGYTFSSITGNEKCPDVLGGTVTLALEDDITCTINNDDVAPVLWLEKVVVNDNGGTLDADDFGILVSGFNAPVFGNPTDMNGQMKIYRTGNGAVSSNVEYTISENDVTGYSEGTWICKDSQLSTVATGSYNEVKLTMNEGDVITCSITNDDTAPTLTLVKLVTNDNGGTEIASAWTLIAQAGAETPIINEQGTVDPQDDFKATTSTVDASAGVFYTLSESGGVPSGYTPGDWSCEGDGGSQINNTVQLALAAVVTCTITNDDQPATLILVKDLPNDDGGQATEDQFGVYIDGSPSSWGEHSVDAGTYTVSEDTIDGYTASDWYTDCSDDGEVTLLPGETKTCTITNDDQPATLILVKDLPNDDGGQATEDQFGVYIDGSPSSWGEHSVDAGTYTVSEDTIDGYTASDWYTDCSDDGEVTLLPGETKTCTITNDDITPTLTLKKVVINEDGRDATQDNFVPTIMKKVVEWDTLYNLMAGGDGYELNELVLEGGEGYKASGWNCDGGELIGAVITLELDEDVICTITNDDQKVGINVIKEGPETAVAGQEVTFTFTVTNTGDVPLEGVTVEDSITGSGVYISGDINKDSKLDLDEVWVYEAIYTIPLNQVQPVENTVTACGYTTYIVLEFNETEYEEVNFTRLDSHNERRVDYKEKEVQLSDCDDDDHSLTIPQVLAEVTPTPQPQVLASSGSNSYMATLASLLLIGATAGLTRAVVHKQ